MRYRTCELRCVSMRVVLGVAVLVVISGSTGGCLSTGDRQVGFAELRFHGEHHCMDASADSAMVAVGLFDNRVLVWDTTTGKLRWTFGKAENVGHYEPVFSGVWSVCFSPDGKFLAAGSLIIREYSGGEDFADGLIRIWSIATGELVYVKTTDSPVTSLRYSSGGHYLASGHESGAVNVWDVVQKELSGEYETPDATAVEKALRYTLRITAVAFSPDGEYLAWSDDRGGIHIVDLSSPVPVITRLHRGSFAIADVAFSPSGRSLIALAASSQMLCWGIRDRGGETKFMEYGGGAKFVEYGKSPRIHLLGGMHFGGKPCGRLAFTPAGNVVTWMSTEMAYESSVSVMDMFLDDDEEWLGSFHTIGHTVDAIRWNLVPPYFFQAKSFVRPGPPRAARKSFATASDGTIVLWEAYQVYDDERGRTQGLVRAYDALTGALLSNESPLLPPEDPIPGRE